MNLSNLLEELSSCQCTTTLYGEKEETKNCVLRIQNRSRVFEKIRARTVVVSWAWIREEIVRNSYVQPNGEWDRVAEDMMLNFSESGHPVFRGSSALERAKDMDNCLYTSVATTTPLNWFFARSSPSISAVSTEQ